MADMPFATAGVAATQIDDLSMTSGGQLSILAWPSAPTQLAAMQLQQGTPSPEVKDAVVCSR